jgi:hypothetical protein
MTGRRTLILVGLAGTMIALPYACNDRERQLSERVTEEVDKRAFSEGDKLPQNVAQPNQNGEGDLNPASGSPSPNVVPSSAP